MTHATKAIFFWLLSDYIKVSNISTDQMLYTDSDLEAAMDKIETINFHEEKEVSSNHLVNGSFLHCSFLPRLLV